MRLILSGSGSPALMEATTVVCGFAFQDRVFRVHFDWDAPSVRAAPTVAGQNLPINNDPNCVS
jgi:hypothetical protein